MTAGDLAVIVRSVAPVMREYVATSLGALAERLTTLEARIAAGTDAPPPPDLDALAAQAAALIPAPRDGIDGKDAEPIDLELVAKRAAVLVPVPLDGAPGKDAEPVDVEAIAAAAAALITLPPPDVEAIAAKAAALVPKPLDGAPGKDAAEIDLNEIAAKAALMIPAPRDGIDGTNGKDAEPPNLDAIAVKAAALIPPPKDGAPGAAGVGLAGAVIDKAGHLVVTLTDGTMRELGPVVGRDGEPGPPGLGFDDFEVLHDGERSFTFRMSHGDQQKSWTFAVPAMLYRGVFQTGQTYSQGDVSTWAGSMWVARATTADKPGDGATAWQLAVKAGRDGKSGPKGDPGISGPKGDKGDPGKYNY